MHKVILVEWNMKGAQEFLAGEFYNIIEAIECARGAVEEECAVLTAEVHTKGGIILAGLDLY